MRHPMLIIITLLIISNAHATNEWVNPDQVAPPPGPKTKSERTPKTERPAPKLNGELMLESKRVCDYQLSYNDKGSGGKQDGSFFIPNPPAGYLMIGGYAQGNYYAPSGCILTVKLASNQNNALLQAPKSWQRVWTDKGSGANKDGSIWHPIPRSDDYICLGSIAREGYEAPNLRNYTCVHHCLVEEIPVTNPVWSTRGTGANQQAYIYQLHNSNSFFAVPDSHRPIVLQDLKGNPSCTF